MEEHNLQSLAYIAGIIDGEGTITLSKIHRDSKFRHPVVSVTSTSYEILEFLLLYYDGVIVHQKTYKKHHKNAWVWKITYSNALKFLSDIYPYLQDETKRHRAQLLITRYESVTPRNGRYSEVLKKAKEQFEYEFFHPEATFK